MIVTIQLSEEQTAALQAQAAAEGVTVDTLVQRLADGYAQQRKPASMKKQDDRPIWEVILDNMKDVPPSEFEKLPKDGASEHDHYLYGHPKRHQ
jgi:hypothetical protein